MKLDSKAVLLLAAAGLLLAAGGYYLGTSTTPEAPDVASAPQSPGQAPAPTAAQPAQGGQTQAGRLAPDAQMPASGHPPIPSAAPAAESAATADNRKFTHFQVGNRNVKAMLADDGVVWVGTSGGVVRYDLATDTHRLFDNRGGLLSNGIFWIGKIDGRISVGTYGGGLSIYDEARDLWDHYNIQHGLADAFVYGVLEASNGDVWIATWSGANRIRGGALDDRSKWDTYTVANTDGGLPNDWVYGVAEGEDGVIWLATEGGLARYEDGDWKNWQHEDGLGAPYETVRESIQFRNDPAKVSSHHARQKAEQGLEQVDVAYNPNYIVSLAVDPDGTVWAGTWGGGLAHFDGDEWTN
ncbi:MAG: two-component regulator propeller domain-containing protein, partial [Gammaproteobacteria bacterium]|nr:two-component regulator propeller domain-containing protein [Gammaproteobacteria bacterium]